MTTHGGEVTPAAPSLGNDVTMGTAAAVEFAAVNAVTASEECESSSFKEGSFSLWRILKKKKNY